VTITRALPFADYLALPSVHFSTLRAIDVSPLHYRRAVDHVREDTDALRIGRAVHALVLTPEVPDVRVWDGTRRGKAWVEFRDANAGKTILTATEHSRAVSMRDAVHRHPAASSLLSHGDPEVTVEWTDAETGLACRCRVDWMRSGSVVELKTARASHPRAFSRAFASMMYHAQLAFYADGIAAVTGGLAPLRVDVIAVEKDPPHDVCVYEVPDDVIEAGRRKYTGWLRAVADCTASGKWPGAGGDVAVPLVLPAWAVTDGLEDVDMSGIGTEDAGDV